MFVQWHYLPPWWKWRMWKQSHGTRYIETDIGDSIFWRLTAPREQVYLMSSLQKWDKTKAQPTPVFLLHTCRNWMSFLSLDSLVQGLKYPLFLWWWRCVILQYPRPSLTQKDSIITQCLCCSSIVVPSRLEPHDRDPFPSSSGSLPIETNTMSTLDQ